MRTLIIKRKNYLPHQYAFMKCAAMMKALVAGYGSGKTYVFLRECLKHHIMNIRPEKGTSSGWVVYPTLELARDLFIDDFKELLDAKGIKYKYRDKEMSFQSKYGKIKIYTLERPERMVGSNLSWIGIDEFDTARYKNAMLAYKKIIGRMRGSDDAQLFIVTTPEGFGATYTIFVEKKSDSKKIFHARTMDNPHLPANYIERMREEYDPKLLEAYLNGEFVNLNSGIIYYGFDRKMDVDLNNSLQIDPCVPLRIYFDFNVSPFTIGYGQHKDKMDIRCIGEITMKGHSNTESACRELIKELPKDIDVVVYGDAAGNWNSTNSNVSDYQLIDKVFRPYFRSLKYKVPKANPGVKNRINAVNSRLSRRSVKINARCTSLIKDFEQVSYADNGRDIDKSNIKLTHPSDAFGYYITVEFPITKPSHNEETRSL